jgi:esterase/lipase
MLYSKIEGAGRPLLILHGFLGMSDNWKTLGMQFATEGLKFIC